MTTEVRVLIADDHQLIRERLRQAIEAEPDFKVIAEAVDKLTALKLLQELQPEIAILDIFMRERNGFGKQKAVGFELAREIIAQQLPIKVIFLTMDDDEDLFEAAMKLGAQGYLLKECLTSEIIAGIKRVAAGNHYISSQLHDYLLSRETRDLALIEEIPGLKDLTLRELEVLALIVAGESSKEIAAELNISVGVVDGYRTKISQKFKLHGPHDLPRFILKHKVHISQAIEAARRLRNRS